jgi:hypothetical protein
MKVSGQFHMFEDSLDVMPDGKESLPVISHVTDSGSLMVIKTTAWCAKMYHIYVEGLKNAFLACSYRYDYWGNHIHP